MGDANIVPRIIVACYIGVMSEEERHPFGTRFRYCSRLRVEVYKNHMPSRNRLHVRLVHYCDPCRGEYPIYSIFLLLLKGMIAETPPAGINNSRSNSSGYLKQPVEFTGQLLRVIDERSQLYCFTVMLLWMEG